MHFQYLLICNVQAVENLCREFCFLLLLSVEIDHEVFGAVVFIWNIDSFSILSKIYFCPMNKSLS